MSESDRPLRSMGASAVRASSLAVAVGSPRERVCSIGAFARAETRAFIEQGFRTVLLEADEALRFPLKLPPEVSLLNLHIPSLHDRRRPWNVLTTMLQVRALNPGVKIVLTVHELSEAPRHWCLRARMAAAFAHGIIVNTEPDFQIASSWGRPLIKAVLGPTLWNDRLMEAPSVENITAFRKQALDRLRQRFTGLNFGFQTPWVLHAGLITPGKGLEFLKTWCEREMRERFPEVQFVLMGGFGPKQRDLQFAQSLIGAFEGILKDRFTFIKEPDDAVFADALIAADLLALPYDIGVSERRSSFLAACSSGANIWTTLGELSAPMGLEEAGVFKTPATAESAQILSSLSAAVREVSGSGLFPTLIKRRIQNLKWASPRSWQTRVAAVIPFFDEVLS